VLSPEEKSGVLCFTKIKIMSTKTKSVFALIVLLNVCAVASAFVSAEKGLTNKIKIGRAQEQRTEIKAEALPEAAKKTLNDKFKGWTIAKAFEVVKGGAKEYEVELSMNDETKTVKLDKDGNLKQ
jgi:hypothetical protein